MSWHCGCDVIHVNQEESRRYYTTWGTPSLNLTCLLIVPSNFTLAVLLKRKSLSHLYINNFCHVRLLAEALAVAPLSNLCQRPLTGQRKLLEPSSSLGRHLRCSASREPVGLQCFGIVDSLFLLKPELSLTQDAI